MTIKDFRNNLKLAKEIEHLESVKKNGYSKKVMLISKFIVFIILTALFGLCFFGVSYGLLYFAQFVYEKINSVFLSCLIVFGGFSAILSAIIISNVDVKSNTEKIDKDIQNKKDKLKIDD